MQGYQWYGVKRINSYFRELGELWKKVWGTSLLPKVVLISSIKPISSCISLTAGSFAALPDASQRNSQQSEPQARHPTNDRWCQPISTTERFISK